MAMVSTTVIDAWDKRWTAAEGRADWIDPDPDVMALLPELKAQAPTGNRRMSANPVANGGLLCRPLDMAEFRSFAVDVEKPGATVTTCISVGSGCVGMGSKPQFGRVCGGKS